MDDKNKLDYEKNSIVGYNEPKCYLENEIEKQLNVLDLSNFNNIETDYVEDFFLKYKFYNNSSSGDFCLPFFNKKDDNSSLNCHLYFYFCNKLFPVISAGFSISIKSNNVGAKSASLPSLIPYGLLVTNASGTGFVV